MGRKNLQLQFEVRRCGCRPGRKSVRSAAKADRHGSTGHQAVQLIARMPAKPALAKDTHHLGDQGFVTRGQHVAPVQRKAHRNPVLGQVGPFEVQHHAVGKADLPNAIALFGCVADNAARRTEIGIGKGRGLLGFWRDQFCLCSPVPGFAQRPCAACRFAPTLETDQGLVERHDFPLERGQHLVRRDFRRESLKPRQRAAWCNRNDIVFQQRDDRAKQGAVALGAFAGRNVAGGGAGIRQLLRHFGLGEAECQRAAIFLCRSQQAAFPAAVDSIDHQAGRALLAELVARADPGKTERGVCLARAAQ